MGYRLLYLLLLCVIAHVGAQGEKPFDCRRTNSQCRLNVGVCRSVGTCDCSGADPRIDGYQGFDCNLKTDTIVTPCSLCKNGGTCYNSTNVIRCYCPEKYTGETCEQLRVDVTVCNGTHIGMYIKPHHATIFNGLISIVQQTRFDSEILLTDGECRRRGSIDTEADNSYFILTSLDSSSPCNDALQIINSTEGIVRYTYKVRVNYGFFENDADETHTFICEIHPDGNQAGVQVGSDRRNLNGTIVSGKYRLVDLQLLFRNGNQALGSATSILVHLGQELFVGVKLKENAYYDTLAIDSCFVYPNNDGSGNTVEFFKDRCPNTQYLSVVDSSVGSIRRSDREVLVAFNVIRFPSSLEIFISCNVTLCHSGNLGLCDPYNCSTHVGGPGSGHGRRKREADFAEHLYLTQRVIVFNSKEEVDKLRGCETKVIYQVTERPFYDNTLFVALASVSGILLVVTLVIAIVLCRRRYRSIKHP